ncbi:MAG: Fe-S protein [Gammaproteobacteria bacterium]|nr:Fe-S protein [Gammaproteobacteria bacterium]
MIFLSNSDRPFHFGPYPLERLPRAKAEQQSANAELSLPTAPVDSLGCALERYRKLFLASREGPVAPETAPLPDDLMRRTIDIKGAGYFLDASQMGICPLQISDWRSAPAATHEFAVVVLVAYPRCAEPANPASNWTRHNQHGAAETRAVEIAVCLAHQIRNMGFAATAHGIRDGEGDVAPGPLVIRAGLAVSDAGRLTNPFVGDAFAVAVVTTAYPLICDQPLAEGALRARNSLGYWLGLGGATSGLERWRRQRRATHLSRYPMEDVGRVARPTTLILDDEVPRVPKRAAFFERAMRGDLDARMQRERTRFSFKHPLAAAMTSHIRAMAPLQDGPVAPAATGLEDPAANARALKSLGYFLGADLVGICEIPRYAWYSHHADGRPIEPYHRYAVVMLIDQGYDTMEGASGDDWISGAQSMRAYMRGADIAGIMAEHLRNLGHASRAQTNIDSDVLHIPLILWAGLGELSRIGELVLNPFVGPRFKSVVMTTDLPLQVDAPIDFGLQRFCASCRKCARECPCDAIPYGDKVMFNGYAIWKPDVERCTRYRLSNQRGLACGRCMKTCPLNKDTTLDAPLYIQIANWLGIHARWLKPVLPPLAAKLDDWLGYGRRLPAKKWWLDLEYTDGKCVTPKGVNQRDIAPGSETDPAKHKVAYYHASMMPPPDAGATPYPVDRKQGIAAADVVETPEQALARRARGERAPAHYQPTPAANRAGISD